MPYKYSKIPASTSLAFGIIFVDKSDHIIQLSILLPTFFHGNIILLNIVRFVYGRIDS